MRSMEHQNNCDPSRLEPEDRQRRFRKTGTLRGVLSMSAPRRVEEPSASTEISYTRQPSSSHIPEQVRFFPSVRRFRRSWGHFWNRFSAEWAPMLLWPTPAADIMSSNEVLVNPGLAGGVAMGAGRSERAAAASDRALGDEVPPTANRSFDAICNA